MTPAEEKRLRDPHGHYRAEAGMVQCTMAREGAGDRIRWSPRVHPTLIRRLYEADASGVPDLPLCDSVGIRLYLRCESIVRVHGRQVECPACRTVFEVPSSPMDAAVRCPAPLCAWYTTPSEYARSWSKQRIWAGKALAAFEQYYDRYSHARTYPEKILLIDRLIHSFHWDMKEGAPNRSAANNLIEGNHEQVMALLDGLSSADSSGHLQWRSTARVMMRRRKGGTGAP